MTPAAMEQAKSVVMKLVAMLGTIAVTLGLIDANQAAQLADAVGQLFGSGIAVVGACLSLLALIHGVLNNTPKKTVAKAAEVIRSDPTIQTAAPVIHALRDAEATVNTANMATKLPA